MSRALTMYPNEYRHPRERVVAGMYRTAETHMSGSSVSYEERFAEGNNKEEKEQPGKRRDGFCIQCEVHNTMASKQGV